MTGTAHEINAFLHALDALDAGLRENVARNEKIFQRIDELREALRSGRPLRSVVPEEEAPPIVRLLSENARVFDECGARVRRTEARALYVEGATMEEIAELFGVSRQRVSVLLRDPGPPPA